MLTVRCAIFLLIDFFSYFFLLKKKFFFFFWLHWVLVVACKLLVTTVGSSSLTRDRTWGPPALGVWSLSHWDTREVPPLFSRFYSYISHYRVLSRIPCAIHVDPYLFSILYIVVCICQSQPPSLCIPHPHFFPGNHKFVFCICDSTCF